MAGFTLLQELHGVVVDTEVESGQDGEGESDQPDQPAAAAWPGEILEPVEGGLLAVHNSWVSRGCNGGIYYSQLLSKTTITNP